MRAPVATLVLLFLCGAPAAAAADDAALTLSQFLAQVAKANLELLAQRQSVPIAAAQIAVARVFPDVTLTGGVNQVDVSGQGAPLVSTLGLTLPLELGGKRGARIAAAQADERVAQSDLEDFFRKLRATAATAYVDSLYARLALERKQRTLASLEKLVAVNQHRFAAGDISEVTVTQSRVEARRFQSDVLAAEATVRTADLSLSQYLSQQPRADAPPLTLHGDLRIPARRFEAEKLLAMARSQRPDVHARQQSLEAGQARVRLARANRWIDLTFNVSWQRSLYSEPFASPAYDALGATLSFPLPLSRIYKGELTAALATEKQLQQVLDGTTLRATIEVQQALVRYEAARKQVDLYTQDVLADADRVLAATLYTFQRGGATLLEVLTAQRTVDEVYLAYYDALAEHARQLIAVEQAAGFWDVSF